MGGETCQGKVTLARLRDQSRWIRAKMPTTLVNIDQPFFFSRLMDCCKLTAECRRRTIKRRESDFRRQRDGCSEDQFTC